MLLWCYTGTGPVLPGSCTSTALHQYYTSTVVFSRRATQAGPEVRPPTAKAEGASKDARRNLTPTRSASLGLATPSPVLRRSSEPLRRAKSGAAAMSRWRRVSNANSKRSHSKRVLSLRTQPPLSARGSHSCTAQQRSSQVKHNDAHHFAARAPQILQPLIVAPRAPEEATSAKIAKYRSGAPPMQHVLCRETLSSSTTRSIIAPQITSLTSPLQCSLAHLCARRREVSL